MTPLRLVAKRALAAVAVISVALLAFERVVVSGASMLPTLEPGDRLLVVRIPRSLKERLRLLPGRLVALYDPRVDVGGGRLLVKRLRSWGPDGFEVEGDNEAASTDSRAFGVVPHRLLKGVVLYRYSPAGRTGLLR